jgi:hemoglobin/transferrin/lactoferrin receptor protein
VYLQGDVRLGAANLLAGVRHDRVQGSAAWLNQGTITTGLARSDSATSGQLGVVFEVRPLLRPYAQLARGFRAGDMRERFEFSPRGDGFFYFGNPQIRPEIATQVEVGVKGDTQPLAYALAVYRKRITDHITGRVTGAVHPSGLPIKQTENIGRVTIAGAEGEARWQWRPGQWLAAGFSVVRADNDTLGEPLFQSPADEVSIGWEGAVAAGWRADATLRMVRRQDRVATVFARGTENATPGFATADLGATWQRGAHRLRLAVRNVADKRYHEHLTEGVSGHEIAAPGRNVSLSWEGRF